MEIFTPVAAVLLVIFASDFLSFEGGKIIFIPDGKSRNRVTMCEIYLSDNLVREGIVRDCQEHHRIKKKHLMTIRRILASDRLSYEEQVILGELQSGITTGLYKSEQEDKILQLKNEVEKISRKNTQLISKNKSLSSELKKMNSRKKYSKRV